MSLVRSTRSSFLSIASCLLCSHKVFTIFRCACVFVCVSLSISLRFCDSFCLPCISSFPHFTTSVHSSLSSRIQSPNSLSQNRATNGQFPTQMFQTERSIYVYNEQLLNDNLRHIGWNFPVSARNECIYCVEFNWNEHGYGYGCMSCWFKFVVRLPNGFLPFDDAFHYSRIENKKQKKLSYRGMNIIVNKWPNKERGAREEHQTLTDQGYKSFSFPFSFSLKWWNRHETGSSFRASSIFCHQLCSAECVCVCLFMLELLPPI